MNENLKNGFKIVQKIGKKYYSSELEKVGVEYKINKSTLPRNGDGPLTVFNNIDDVNNYLKFIKKYVEHYYSEEKVEFVVFKCKYELSKLDKLWYERESIKDIIKIQEIDNYMWGESGAFTFLKDLEDNTILASEVILKEKFYD